MPGKTVVSFERDVAYKNLVNQKSREDASWVLVTPGDPAKSLFYEKVSKKSPAVGSSMPYGGRSAPLNAKQTETIRSWIEGGAKP